MNNICGHASPFPGCKFCELGVRDGGSVVVAAKRKKINPRSPACFNLNAEKVIDRREALCVHAWIVQCEIFGKCTTGYVADGVANCLKCPAYTIGSQKPIPVLLRMPPVGNCPGDIVAITNAVHSLHAKFPGVYATYYEGPCQEIFDFDPLIQPVRPWEEDWISREGKLVEMKCDLINNCDNVPYHFSEGFARNISEALGVQYRLEFNVPKLFLSSEECFWIGQVEEIFGKRKPYWIVNAGYKKCFTAKYWGQQNYQSVIDRLKDEILFVQIGEKNHYHPPLDGVVDLRGKTDTRQLMRLVYHSSGGVGPITFLQHLCAGFSKPYACIAGGREPVHWISYPKQKTFHTINELPCCFGRSCWKSRVRPLGDGESSDDSLCVSPKKLGVDDIGECMERIDASEVAKWVKQSNAMAMAKTNPF